MSPRGARLLHIEGLSLKAHGPSSLCVDLVNYLGCQGPTTAYPLREGGGVGGAGGVGAGGGGCSVAVRKQGSVRAREGNHCRGLRCR